MGGRAVGLSLWPSGTKQCGTRSACLALGEQGSCSCLGGCPGGQDPEFLPRLRQVALHLLSLTPTGKDVT